MAKYLLIESRNHWESGDVPYFFGLARDLAGAGNDVTLYLVQNGVMIARQGAKDGGLLANLGGKVKVLADDFSLRERGIDRAQLVSAVNESNIDLVVDLVAEGAKSMWH